MLSPYPSIVFLTTRLRCSLWGHSLLFVVRADLGGITWVVAFVIKIFLNGPFPGYFSLFLSFQYTVDSKQMFNKYINFCQWLDSNRGPLPTESQPLRLPQPRFWLHQFVRCNRFIGLKTSPLSHIFAKNAGHIKCTARYET